MVNTKKLEQDLSYVRQVVEASRRQRFSPASIYLLWAGITLFGIALPDFRPEWTGLYWIVVAPAGFAVSWVIGVRSSRQSGEVNRKQGLMIAFHWLIVVAAFFLSLPLMFQGEISGPGLGKMLVLLSAVSYLLFGLHVDRGFLPSGVVILLGYLWLLLVDTYAWTTIAVAISLSLILAARASSQSWSHE